MRQAQMLKISGGTRGELDGSRRRGVLPFGGGPFFNKEEEIMAQWEDFTMRDALMFRCFTDLTRSGLKGAVARDMVGNGFHRIENGRIDMHEGQAIIMQPARGIFDDWDDAILIAREVYTADYVAEFKTGLNFSATWWGGTKEEIESAIAFANARETVSHRETLSVHYYNVSKARAEVIAAARALELPELEDVKGR
ncbi:hypothetical protein SAMN05877809_102337 [Rhodobacter sp. JA431]|uniref:hypothetical protein n=1 Tax=Rhodobacter sp. JA431 TaxID=570013 RepID=UPI000BC49A7C|nr:hypothetical protein [Rhodobacter sp. JA431]SOB98805.1 hypothetical protein SAMN05877809_102337 [Rhodobacter sp. JA431]